MTKARSKRKSVTSHKMVDSPVGRLTLVATDEGLAAILWENDRPGRVRLNIEAEDDSHPVLVETERQLDEYFAGRRTVFTVTLDLAGTAFQRKVWNALLTIPFGETRSYGQIARADREPRRRARGRRGQRQESRVDRRAVPPGHRIHRHTHGIRRRARRQGDICWRWKERGRTRSSLAPGSSQPCVEGGSSTTTINASRSWLSRSIIRAAWRAACDRAATEGVG